MRSSTFLDGGRRLVLKFNPSKCHGRTSERRLINYVHGSRRDREGKVAGCCDDKRILLFARASSKFKYVFCGLCDCNDMEPIATDSDLSCGTVCVNIILHLVEFEQLVAYRCNR